MILNRSSITPENSDESLLIETLFHLYQAQHDCLSMDDGELKMVDLILQRIAYLTSVDPSAVGGTDEQDNNLTLTHMQYIITNRREVLTSIGDWSLQIAEQIHALLSSAE